MTEAFWDLLPTYMAMGMSQDEYWTKDSHLAVAYRRMWELKKEQLNHQLWWQGFYIHDAVGVIVKNALRRPGERIVHYPNKPYELEPQTEEAKVIQRRKARQEALDYFDNLKSRMEKKYGRRE